MVTSAYSSSAATVLTMNRELTNASAWAPPAPDVPNARESTASRRKPRTRDSTPKSATTAAARAMCPRAHAGASP